MNSATFSVPTGIIVIETSSHLIKLDDTVLTGSTWSTITRNGRLLESVPPHTMIVITPSRYHILTDEEKQIYIDDYINDRMHIMT